MMYRRYQPNPGRNPAGQPPPPSGMPAVKPPPSIPKPEPKPPPKPEPKGIWGWIPPALYNPETKKVLGMFSGEDLLLIGLIFLLLENEEKQDNTLIYALLYILLSDYFLQEETISPPNCSARVPSPKTKQAVERQSATRAESARMDREESPLSAGYPVLGSKIWW